MASFTMFGGSFSDIPKWSISYKNNLKELYAQSSTGSLPKYIVGGMTEVSAKVTHYPLDLTQWSYVYGAGAKFDSTFVLTRTAVSDILTLTLKNCRLGEAKQSVPESQDMPEELDVQAEYMTATSVDSTPYW
jgi:hypothetical protein